MAQSSASALSGSISSFTATTYLPAARFHAAAPYSARQISVLGALRSMMSRSEEHTSELQSLTNLVCRLLLEKKKDTTRTSICGIRQRDVLHSHCRHVHKRLAQPTVGPDALASAD